jgi:hypothetical protein
VIYPRRDSPIEIGGRPLDNLKVKLAGLPKLLKETCPLDYVSSKVGRKILRPKVSCPTQDPLNRSLALVKVDVSKVLFEPGCLARAAWGTYLKTPSVWLAM